MNNFTIINTSIIVLVTLAFSFIFISVITFIHKKKHFSGAPPELKLIYILIGRILSATILISGIFPTLRDFILITNSGPLDQSKWNFIALCLLAVCLTYLVAIAGEYLFYRTFFFNDKNITNITTEDKSYQFIRLSIIVFISVVLVLSLSIILPFLIPSPKILEIR